jgi:hypothetical protein
VQLGPYIHQDRSYWFAWSLFVPSTYQNIYPVKVALGQFLQEGSAKPPLMFQNGSGGYWADLNQLGKDPVLLIPETELKERWHDLLVNVKWTKGKSGFLRIWVDGNKKVDFKGATLVGKGDVYFKYGIYRSFLSRAPQGKVLPDQVVYFDEVKWGTSRKAVDPQRAATPQLGKVPAARKKSRIGSAISGMTPSKSSPR